MEKLLERFRVKFSGTLLDLSEMAAGRREPQPNEGWPHPLFRPRWYLWLALWHEARGDAKSAHRIALMARDPRYGLTLCQPALEALLERTGGKA